MSWETLKWAGDQRTDNVAMQCVLFVVANAADPDGVAFRWWKRRDHWWTYLVERTGLAHGSVYRTLGKLEELGLIKRDKVTPEDGSKPQPIIRLQLGVTYIASSESPSETVANEAGESPSETPESPCETEAKTLSLPERLPESPSETPLIMSPFKNPSPTQTLPHTEAAPQASEASPPSQPEGEAAASQSSSEPPDPRASPEMQKKWRRFCAIYPDGIIDPEQAESEFFKLTSQQADNCIEGAALYAARCKRRRDKPMKAHLFIRKHTWAGLLAEKPATKPAASFTLVPFNSMRGFAVANLYLMTHIGVPVRCHGDGGVECYSVPFAPTDQVMAFADVPRRSQWEFYSFGTAQHFRWKEFIFRHTGKGLALATRGTRPGFLAPHPWPPRVDGTWSLVPEPSATGPPSSTNSRTD